MTQLTAVAAVLWQIASAPAATRVRIINGVNELLGARDYDGVHELLQEAALYKDLNEHAVVTKMCEHEKMKELKKSYELLARVQVRLSL